MTWHLVPASSIGDLAQLQSLAERAFGVGDRRADWFLRKLVREHADPALSCVAIRDDDSDDPRDPSSWVGYVLVGRPPSRWPIARTLGTCVLPELRGRGVATAMLDAVARASADAGAASLELAAELALEPFYLARGFVLERRISSLLAFARGTDGALPGPAPWADDDLPIELHAYLAEAWTMTPDAERHSLRFSDPHACVHVCREARAFALHRTVVADHTKRPASIFTRVLEALPAAAPVIAIAMPEVSSITASLRETGIWVDAQRGSVVRRDL